MTKEISKAHVLKKYLYRNGERLLATAFFFANSGKF